MLIKAVLVFMCMMFSVGVLAAGENDGTKKNQGLWQTALGS